MQNRILKKAVPILSWIFSVLILLYLLLFLIVHLPPVKKYLLNIVAKQGSKAIGGTLFIGSYFTNLVSFINLYDIKAISKGSVKDSVLIDKLQINFSLFPLLEKRVVIPSVSASGGSLYAVRDKNGRIHFPFITEALSKPGKKRKSSWQVQLKTFCASNISLKYYDQKLNTTVSVQDIDGCTDIDSLHLLLYSNNIDVKSPWWNGTIDTFHVSAKILDTLVFISDFLLHNEETDLVINGHIPLRKSNTFNVQGILQTKVDPFSRALLPAEHSISGAVSSRFQLKGSFYNPYFQTTVTSPSIYYRDFLIDTLALHVTYSDNESFLIDGYLHNLYAYANITGTIGLINLLTNPQFRNYSTNININRIRIDSIKRYLNRSDFPLSGIGSVHIEATGHNLNELPGNAAIDISIPKFNPSFSDTLWALLNIINNKWNLQASVGNGNRLNGQGKVRLFDVLEGSIKGDINNPSLLTSLFFDNPVNGQIFVDGSFRNIFKSPRLSLKINTDSLSFSGLQFSSIRSTLSYNNSWYIDNTEFYVSGDLNNVSIPGIKGFQGIIESHVNARGHLFYPVVKSKVKITKPGYKKYQADHFESAFFFNNNQLIWDSLFLVKDTFALQAFGALNLMKKGFSYQSDLNFLVNDLSAIFLRSSGYKKNNFIQATAIVDYARTGSIVPGITLSSCVDGLIKINAQIDPDFCINYGNLLIDLNEFFTSQLKPFKYTGYFTLDSNMFSGDARVIDKNDSISSLLFSMAARLQDKCTGKKLSFDNGSTMTFNVNNFKFGDVLAASVPDLFIRGIIDGSAEASRKNGIWQLYGNFSALADTLSYLPKTISSDSIYLRTRISGSNVNPELAFSLSTKNFSFESVQTNVLHLQSKYYKNFIQIDSLYSDFYNGGYLQIDGLIPLTKRPQINPKFNYIIKRLPLSIINPFIPTVLIKSGIASGKGTIQSISGKLNSNGNIDITDMQFDINNCSGSAGPFQISIDLKKDSLLDTIYGVWDDGLVNGRGFVKINSDSIEDTRTELSIKNIKLDCQDIFLLGIRDATATIQKQKGSFQITTNVNLDESRIDKTFTISGLVGSFLEGKRIPSLPDPFLKRTSIIAAINLNRNLLIDSNLGRFFLDGSMNVTGTLAQPKYNGILQIYEGKVRYLNSDFNIDKGTISQFNDVEINPELNISASSNVPDFTSYQREYLITITVRGTLNEPQFVLTSNPQLQEQEILNLLTLGGIEGSPGLGRRTGQILGSYAAGLGSQYIEQITGLGNVNLSGNALNQNGGLSLSIGENLTNRLSVSYRTDVTDFGQYAVQIVYRIFPQLRFLGGIDAQGNSDIGVRFIYRR